MVFFFFYKTIEILSFRRIATFTASIYYMHIVADIFYLFMYIYIYKYTGSWKLQRAVIYESV